MTRCGSAKAPFEEHLFRFYATAAKDLPGDVKPRQANSANPFWLDMTWYYYGIDEAQADPSGETESVLSSRESIQVMGLYKGNNFLCLGIIVHANQPDRFT